MTKYQVSLAGRTIELLVGDKEAASSGLRASYEIFRISDYRWLLNVDGRVFTLSADRNRDTSPGDRLHFTLNGNRFEAVVDDERSLLMKSVSRAYVPTGGILEIIAPMPGLIAKLEVEKGTKIRVGDAILVLEAMKMENEIRSPEHGTIVDVLVKSGVAVEKGEILVLIEPTVD
ncbi:MAG: biotin/lipoyl-binding protein [Ignavibacteriales bacterium]|nr:biotin/lipoyl-binding protein [Ignavibacteriales bacterium]